MFGPYQRVVLILLDLPDHSQILEGVKMELDDGAYPILSSIVVSTNLSEAFKDLDVALLVGAKPRGPGME